MKPDRKFYVFLFLAIAETLLLLWFSFLPGVDLIVTGFLRVGDLEHFLAYGIYGFLLGNLFRYFTNNKKAILFSFLVGSAVGGISEGIQLFLPYRAGDAIDLAVDSVGSFFGGYASSKFKPFS